MEIEFILNGKEVKVDCPPLKRLIYILRQDFNLTGTKIGCKKGECCSCLVFLDETLVNACLVPAFRLTGKKIMTIEGFCREKEFADIEKAFLETNIITCAFCTPALVMATQALLLAQYEPSKQEIRQTLSGSFCHYTGFNQVLKAVTQAAKLRSKKKNGKKK